MLIGLSRDFYGTKNCFYELFNFLWHNLNWNTPYIKILCYYFIHIHFFIKKNKILKTKKNIYYFVLKTCLKHANCQPWCHWNFTLKFYRLYSRLCLLGQKNKPLCFRFVS
uniref:Uncharacterized protein n=1 Tax=Cacopsylla melanoneura TaxID=428564 RepID=A0A8D8XC96_9HEMI